MSDFIVYPAIDLRQGNVVRLSRGDPSQQTVYERDPARVAERWLAEGARWLHLVNLDGAFGESGAENREAVRRVLAASQRYSGARVQLGGGLRSLDDVESALAAGASRVILGTAAIEQPELVSEAISRFGAEHVAVGLDALEGRLCVRGWTQASEHDVLTFGAQLRESGVRVVIYTDIARDGMQTGIDVEGARRLAEATGLEIIASGGVATLDDVQRVRQAGLAGVIIGRALYEGRLTLGEALRC